MIGFIYTLFTQLGTARKLFIEEAETKPRD
jgi:hypothetical protein